MSTSRSSWPGHCCTARRCRWRGTHPIPPATAVPPTPPPLRPPDWLPAMRCKPTARSGSPPNTTCHCRCCGCRRCARRGATLRRIDVGYWRHCEEPLRRTTESAMSEERELLRETVRGLVAKHAEPEAVRDAMESEGGSDESR